MKQSLLLLIFIFSASFLKAQDVNLDLSIQTVPCPYDSTISTTQYTQWDIYKTLDNTWNGVIDSSFCFSLSNIYSSLDLSSLGVGETVFMRKNLDDNNKILLSNDNLYALEIGGDFISSGTLQLGDTCTNGLCSGVFVAVEIPDSLGTGTAIRWYEAPAEKNWNDIYMTACLPTEYFSNGNYLKEVILKVTTASQNVDINIRKAVLLDIQSAWTSLITVKDSLAVPYSNFHNKYQYNIYESHLVIRSDTTIYPNNYGIEYVDIIPSPNVDTPVTIDIEIDYEATLTLQPFMELQGGYVQNDSSQRHNYNIINNGGSFCFPTIIEKVFTGGNNYIHNDGEVGFSGKMSCMAFQPESKLIVGKSAILNYGEGGIGNLALYPNSEIELKEGASFVLNNNLVLFGSDTKNTPPSITLNEGNELIFGEFARIKNHKSVRSIQQLDVYMKGGTIDFSQLDEDSRQYLNLIYETASPDFQDNIKILGNPVQDMLSLSITNESDNITQIVLLSVEGKTIYTESKALIKGINYINIPVHQLTNGIYFLNIQSDAARETKKIIITN